MSKIVKHEDKEPALLKEFDTARKHAANILEHARRTSHESILLGHELNRLKAESGVQRGGDRKSAEIKLSRESLIGWDELVEQQIGMPYSSAARCMQLATAAKKHIPVLTSEDVLKTPFNALPEQRQAEVVKALEKAADGRSMTQLMFDFGAWKEKKISTPPKATKASAKKRAENKADEVLQALLTSKGATDLFNQVQSITVGFTEFQGVLTDADLAAWETQTTALLSAIQTELKTRRKAK